MTIHLAIGLVFTFFIGYALAHKILPDSTLQEKWALSFSLGLGSVVSLFGLMLFLEILHTPNQLLFILGICVLSTYVVFKPYSGYKLLEKAIFKPDSCKAIIGILALTSLIISIWYPVFITDGIDYEISGKLISLNKNLSSESILRNYPPFIMVSYGFVYFLGGENPKFIFSLLYASLCIVFYWRLIDFGISRKLSSTMTLILGTTPMIWWHSFLGILNLTAGYYFACATLFLFSYLKVNMDNYKSNVLKINYLVLAGFFYGLAIFTRLEFIVYFFVPLFQVMYYHKDSKKFQQIISFFIFPALAYGLAWELLFVGLSDNMLSASAGISPAVYLFLWLLVLLFPFFFKGCFCQKILPLLSKKKSSVHFVFYLLAALLLLIPPFSYLAIEISNLQPIDQFFVKSMFFLKVLTAISANFILFHGFLGISSLAIFFTLPLILDLFRKQSFNKYVCTFIFLVFSLNTLIFSKAAFNKYPVSFTGPSLLHDFIFTAKVIFLYPGVVVNNTQTRSFITFLPISLFMVAYALQNKEKATKNLIRYYKKFHLFLYFTVLSNLIIIAFFFMAPRIQFMIYHWGENRNQLLLSSGPKDNPNMEHLRKTYKALIEIEEQSTNHYPVFLLNPRFSRAEALKILFPRKIYFGVDKAEIVKRDIKKGEIKPDCYFFYYSDRRASLGNFDRQTCRKLRYINVEPSEFHFNKVKM